MKKRVTVSLYKLQSYCRPTNRERKVDISKASGVFTYFKCDSGEEKYYIKCCCSVIIDLPLQLSLVGLEYNYYFLLRINLTVQTTLLVLGQVELKAVRKKFPRYRGHDLVFILKV